MDSLNINYSYNILNILKNLCDSLLNVNVVLRCLDFLYNQGNGYFTINCCIIIFICLINNKGYYLLKYMVIIRLYYLQDVCWYIELYYLRELPYMQGYTTCWVLDHIGFYYLLDM